MTNIQQIVSCWCKDRSTQYIAHLDPRPHPGQAAGAGSKLLKFTEIVNDCGLWSAVNTAAAVAETPGPH